MSYPNPLTLIEGYAAGLYSRATQRRIVETNGKRCIKNATHSAGDQS